MFRIYARSAEELLAPFLGPLKDQLEVGSLILGVKFIKLEFGSLILGVKFTKA
jgi:hypothetical protein